MPNAFATAVTQTRFNVTNNTDGKLANQYILVFLTPQDNAQNWVYAAWQSLSPGNGGTSSFILNQNISGRMLSEDTLYTTNSVEITPGYVSELTNGVNLLPTLAPAVIGSQVSPPTVNSQQSGMKNNTANPPTSMFAQWLVNKNLVVQSINSVSAGGTLSAFELETTLYWAIGQFVQGPTYSYNQITPMTAYELPAGTSVVNVSVTFNTAAQRFQFQFT